MAGGKKAEPIQLAWSLTHDSFLLHSPPHPDLPSPETGHPQKWSSVEEDDESEDSQVSWRFLPLLMMPHSADVSGLSHSLTQLGISLPHKSLFGDVSPKRPPMGNRTYSMVVRHGVEGLRWWG